MKEQLELSSVQAFYRYVRLVLSGRRCSFITRTMKYGVEMKLRRHIRLGSRQSLYSHSRPILHIHRGARGCVPAKKSNTAPIEAMTGTWSAWRFFSTHFSCLGAVIPTHSTSGLALLIVSIISRFRSADHSPKGGERVPQISIRGKRAFALRSMRFSTGSVEPKKNTLRFPSCPIRVIVLRKKSSPVIRAPMGIFSNLDTIVTPAPSGTTRSALHRASRNWASDRATTKECGLAQAKQSCPSRVSITLLARFTASPSEIWSIGMPSKELVVRSRLVIIPKASLLMACFIAKGEWLIKYRPICSIECTTVLSQEIHAAGHHTHQNIYIKQ